MQGQVDVAQESKQMHKLRLLQERNAHELRMEQEHNIAEKNRLVAYRLELAKAELELGALKLGQKSNGEGVQEEK